MTKEISLEIAKEYNKLDQVKIPCYFCESMVDDEEYKQSKLKLTKRERAFCEVVRDGYLARDETGSLYLYEHKPYKGYHLWLMDISPGSCVMVDRYERFFPLFDFIKWEDEEPYSVKEMLEWEVDE